MSPSVLRSAHCSGVWHTAAWARVQRRPEHCCLDRRAAEARALLLGPRRTAAEPATPLLGPRRIAAASVHSGADALLQFTMRLRRRPCFWLFSGLFVVLGAVTRVASCADRLRRNRMTESSRTFEIVGDGEGQRLVAAGR